MDSASAPEPKEARRQLLDSLAEVDPADAPDVADELATMLGDDLDGPLAG